MNHEEIILTMAHLEGAADRAPQAATPATQPGHGDAMATILAALDDAKAENLEAMLETGRGWRG